MPRSARWLRHAILPAVALLLLGCATVLSVAVERRVHWTEYVTACDNRIVAIERAIEQETRQVAYLHAAAHKEPFVSVDGLRGLSLVLHGDAERQWSFVLWDAVRGVSIPLHGDGPSPGREMLQRLVESANRTGAPAAAILPGARPFCSIATSASPVAGGRSFALVHSFDLAQSVERALDSLRPSGVHVNIFDPSTDAPVYSHPSRAAARVILPDGWIQPRPSSWSRRQAITVAGMSLVVECVPTDHFLEPFSVALCWCVLLVGGIVVGLLSRLLVRRGREAAQARELAELRLQAVQQRLQVEQLHAKTAEESLSESEDRFRRAYLDAAVGVAMLDLEARVTLANRALCLMSGYSEPEFLGMRIYDFVIDEEQAESRELLLGLAAGKSLSYQVDRRARRKDGSILTVRSSVSVLLSEGKPSRLLALMQDISEQVEFEAELQYQATHDPLTGLLNRTSFEQSLSSMLFAAGGEGRVALLYIDLDGFKFINDSLGHSIGDLLLPEVTSRLRTGLPPEAVLARMGGDEFTIALPGAGDAAGIERHAQAILAGLAHPISISGYELFVGASIGIAVGPRDGTNPGELVQHADTAMYEAKRNGKSRFCSFTPAMAAAATERLAIEHDLRCALERNEFEIRFQPLVAAHTGALVCFEALCRWRHPERGYVPPDRFIPIAEETALIVPIGRWVLREACRNAVRWNRASSSPVRVAVNVSTVQLAQRALVEDVAAALEESGLPPELLELEVTESVMMRDSYSAMKILEELRRIGVTVALDDFGTGYSSLSQLRRIPIDTLKIDRSFLHDLHLSSAAEDLLAGLISLAHGLGLRVVTEGVETLAQAAILRRLGCDLLQGFLLAKPMRAEEALRLAPSGAGNAFESQLQSLAGQLGDAAPLTPDSLPVRP